MHLHDLLLGSAGSVVLCVFQIHREYQRLVTKETYQKLILKKNCLPISKITELDRYFAAILKFSQV